MNKQLKRAIYYLLIILQMCWWFKVITTYDSTKRSHPYQEEPTRSIPSYSKSNTVSDNMLKAHIQTVKDPHILPLETMMKSTATSMSEKELLKKYYNGLLHHTILPRNASVILTGKYMKNPTKLCSQYQQDLDIFIIVHSAPYHFSRRAMIRSTFANNSIISPYKVQPAFFIGVMPEDKTDASNEVLLQQEFRLHGDLVQMEFNEDFRNLSLKAMLWLKWTNEHCHNAAIILKIDDDVVLDIYRILPLSLGLLSKYNRSIFCNVNKQGTQPIPRIGRTKVDYREFTGVHIYPYTYCSGFIVLFTPDLVPLLFETSATVPFYNVDDVFIFGMVPKFVGQVIYHNLGFNVSIWHQKVYNCTVKYGTQCRYFGTMAEKPEERERVWQAMVKSHEKDFHFPQIKLP